MAQRHSGYERLPNDFYATPAWVTDELLKHVSLPDPLWECAPGELHMVKALQVAGYRVGYIPDADFLAWEQLDLDAKTIITNPPFRLADKFVRKALFLMRPVRGVVAMLLPHSWDTGKTRRDLFQDCAAWQMKLTLTKRIRWENLVQKEAGPSQNHAWYVWDWRKPKENKPILVYGP